MTLDGHVETKFLNHRVFWGLQFVWPDLYLSFSFWFLLFRVSIWNLLTETLLTVWIARETCNFRVVIRSTRPIPGATPGQKIRIEVNTILRIWSQIVIHYLVSEKLRFQCRTFSLAHVIFHFVTILHVKKGLRQKCPPSVHLFNAPSLGL